MYLVKMLTRIYIILTKYQTRPQEKSLKRGKTQRFYRPFGSGGRRMQRI